MAFDLVGPLPSTKQGYKYLLTCICLGSKYPEALPLKRVDAQTVAEGMCEIFSRTGIPNEVLTDQASVFTGKLHKALCNTLGITHLRTSAYHPQTDGCLECWHATLKSMLRKCPDRQQDWDKLLKYMLFAYRAAPHRNTGFSHYEIVYGRQLRGPLDVVKEGLVAGDLRQCRAVEWVNQMKEKLKLMSELVEEKEGRAKDVMKQEYDKRAVERDFSVGTLVLVKMPDMEGKLSDVWDGPYEIVRKAHVNRLKEWKDPEAQVLRVVQKKSRMPKR